MQDWEKQPFVDMAVPEGDCDEGWEPVFFKQWAGLEEKCIEWTQHRRHRTCANKIEARDPIKMADLEGVKICGKRGGKPFVDAIRPNSDGDCPSNTVPCSKFTSPENTICSEAKELDNHSTPVDCPITAVKLLEPDQDELESLDQTFVPFTIYLS